MDDCVRETVADLERMDAFFAEASGVARRRKGHSRLGCEHIGGDIQHGPLHTRS